MDYLSSHDNNLTKMDNYLSQLIKNYSFSETGQVTKLNIYKSVMDQCSGKFKELNDKLIEIQKEFDTRTDSLKVCIPLKWLGCLPANGGPISNASLHRLRHAVHVQPCSQRS
jgi:hypothetical protein